MGLMARRLTALAAAVVAACGLPAQEPAVNPEGAKLALVTPGGKLEARVSALLQVVGGDDGQARTKAVEELKALGRPITPLLVRALWTANQKLDARAREVLAAMVGAPRAGAPSEGLTLSAAPIGLRPDKDACVPVWINLRNTSDHPIRYREVYCDLYWVSPERAQELSSHNREHLMVYWTDNNCFFPVLAPGEQVDYLADADFEGAEPPADGQGPPTLPPGKTSAQPGCVFMRVNVGGGGGREVFASGPRCAELTSGVWRLEYYDEAKATPFERQLRRAANFHGSHVWNESARWHHFMSFRDAPEPSTEDEFVDFLGRWGPRNPKGDLVGAWTRTYAEALPAYRRLPFLDRLSLAVNYTWADNFLIAEEYRYHARHMLETGFAARAAARVARRGYRLKESLAFTAWQMFMSRDPAVRDPALGQELLRAALEAKPENLELQFMKLTFEAKAAARDQVLAKLSAAQKNSIAWDLATGARVNAADRELAVKLAVEALAAAAANADERPLYEDTLAAAYAAKTDFEHAAPLERLAFRSVRDEKLRPAYAARYMHYVALKAAAQGSVFDVDTIRNEKVRVVLLAQHRAETDFLLRRAAMDWLDLLFPLQHGNPAHAGGEPVDF